MSAALALTLSASLFVPAIATASLAFQDGACPSPAAPEARALDQLELQALAVPPHACDEFHLFVRLGGVAHELELHRVSVRARGFELLVDSARGLVRREPPLAATYRGMLDADPTSRVHASFVGGELDVSIATADGSLWHIAPASRVGASAGGGMYATYSISGAAPFASLGAVDEQLRPTQPLEVAQLGVDSEYRHTALIGGVAPTVQRIEAAINSANLRYEQQLGVRFELSTLIVRTDAATDPYAAFEQGGNCSALVKASGDQWLATQPHRAWDMVILYHHKSLNAGPTSCAQIGSLCTCATGNTVISGVDANNGFPYGFLHEVGHVFGGQHGACAVPPGCSDCFIMYCPGQSQTYTYYCACELAQMRPIVEAARCLATVVSDRPPTLVQPSNPLAMAPSNVLSVLLTGTHLADTQYIELDDGGGAQTHRCRTEVVDDFNLLLRAPLPATFGPFSVAVGNSAGRSNFVSLSYVATSPPVLTAPPQVKHTTGLFTRRLYGTPAANVRHLRANGNDATTNVQGFQVLSQQDAVHQLALDSLGQVTHGGVIGAQAPVGSHVHCQFVEYTDATLQTISAVSNITDTLVIP